MSHQKTKDLYFQVAKVIFWSPDRTKIGELTDVFTKDNPWSFGCQNLHLNSNLTPLIEVNMVGLGFQKICKWWVFCNKQIMYV